MCNLNSKAKRRKNLRMLTAVCTILSIGRSAHISSGGAEGALMLDELLRLPDVTPMASKPTVRRSAVSPCFWLPLA